MCKEENLDVLREKIKKITVEIIRLTGKRLSLARKIGKIKSQKKLQIEDPNIEEDLKRIIVKECQIFKVDNRFGLKLVNLLINESKRVQKEALKMGR